MNPNNRFGHVHHAGDGCGNMIPMTEPLKEDPAVPNNPEQRDLRREAVTWIHSSPEVARLFLRFARELASKGRHFGVGLITERVRYECAISSSPSQFKINNNWRAYIARWMIAQDPSLEKWMSFREVRY